jgi:cytochrome c
MKKVFIVLGISLVIAACGGSKPGEGDGSDTGSTTAANQATTAATTNADTATNKTGTTAAPAGKGASLIAGADCTTCHKEHQKIIGPAFADIAKKYTPADTEKLAKKVIAGGSGNWGDVGMTAHPALSLDDAKEMVTYILSVK